jgi:hypothetical protein
MSKPNPVLNFKDALSIIKGMWFLRMEYLTIPHLLLIPVVLIGSIVYTLTKKPKLTDLWLLFALIACGLSCYFIGLGMQLANHDYYFLSSFYPAVIFFTSVALSGSRLLQLKWFYIAFILLNGGTAYISIPKARERSSEVYHIRKKTIESPLRWMYDGDIKLDSANFGTQSKGLIFVLYESAPNTSLIYFNRKGVVFNQEEMARKHPHLEYWINRLNPSFLILQNIWEEQLKKDKPEIYNTWTIRRFDTFILMLNPDKLKAISY